MTEGGPPRRERRGSARGIRFGDARRPEVRLARERERVALRLRAAGATYAEIGRAIGTSRQGAHAALARCHRCPPSAEMRIEALTLDACRVDALLRAVAPRAFAGSTTHLKAAAGLIELHAKLAAALRAALEAKVQG